MSMQDSSVSSNRIRPDSITQGPFSVAQNIYLFFGGGDRGQIVDALIRAIASSDSQLMSVYGEPGSGKTLMSLVLADRMKHRRNIIRYDHDQISTAKLLRHLLIEISPSDADTMTDGEPKESVSAPSTDLALQRLWQALQSPMPNDKPFLLIIDSNAPLDTPTRTLLRQLAALRYQGRSNIQIVMFERENTHRPVGQLERPGFEFWLRRLTLPEIGDYLYHQMLCFDFNRRELFRRDMAYFIAERSEGVISQINELGRHAMMFADLDAVEPDQAMMAKMLMSNGNRDDSDSEIRQKFLSKHRGALIALVGLGTVASIASGIGFMG